MAKCQPFRSVITRSKASRDSARGVREHRQVTLSVERLSQLEATYYPQWMSLTGASAYHSWSKRRAMFWGILTAQDVERAYLNGERIAERIGRPASSPWPSHLDTTNWFFRRAAIANLFDVAVTGGTYTLQSRSQDPWAPLLSALASEMLGDRRSMELLASLPDRATRDAMTAAELEARTEALFDEEAMPALRDILGDARHPDASEFRFAVMRGSRDDAFFWFHREWSFRAKERYRTQIVLRQDNRCACCGEANVPLELNHKQKVLAFGMTVAENLEGLCKPCHTSIDRRGARCHTLPASHA